MTSAKFFAEQISKKNCITASESKGRFWQNESKLKVFESIRLDKSTNRFESRIGTITRGCYLDDLCGSLSMNWYINSVINPCRAAAVQLQHKTTNLRLHCLRDHSLHYFQIAVIRWDSGLDFFSANKVFKHILALYKSDYYYYVCMYVYVCMFIRTSNHRCIQYEHWTG